MTQAALIVVSYGNESVDLTWAPVDAPKIVVCNDGRRPEIIGLGEVRFVVPERNLGFAAAVNLAASSTSADRLVVVNPDCRMAAEHWNALTVAEDREVVVVPLVQPSGASTVVASPYPTKAKFILSALRARKRLSRLPWIRVTRPDQTIGSFSLTTHWFSGAAFSISRQRFMGVDGFDEGYFLYWEDADLSRRLAAADPFARVRVADTCAGTHGVGESNDAPMSVALERLLSARRYASSNPGWGWKAVARLLDLQVSHHRCLPQRPPSSDVLILSLGRGSANGERRRVRSWARIAEAAGMTHTEASPPGASARGLLRPGVFRDALLVVRGELVPEALAVNPLAVATRLRVEGATTLICVTARTYHPRLADLGVRVVLDYVDRLSDSYLDRAGSITVDRPAAIGLKLLAWTHRRFEAKQHPCALACATGVADARKLGVDYVPIVAEPRVPSPASRKADLLFVGTLDYPPNVEALRFLARTWPMLVARRPTVTVIVAGARPPELIIDLARDLGWELVADFEDPAAIYGRALVAVAPITMGSGMQIKVQDAIAFGLPVVATTIALAGYDAGLPAVRADSPHDFVAECLRLLDDEKARRDSSDQGSAWLNRELNPLGYTSALRSTETLRL